MLLAQQLREYIAACFTGISIESHEHDDALAEISRLCHDEGWQLARWNIAEGLQVPGIDGQSAGSDPLAAIRAVSTLATPEGTAILVLQNFHRFLQSAEIVQALVQQITSGKQNRTFVVILAPVVQIPTELEKLIVVIEYELPSREQLAEIARGVATEDGELPGNTDMAAVLDAAVGLTRYEAEGAFSLALVRQGKLRPQEIWELKSQVLKKSGLLSLHRGSERFADLGGLDALKSFCLRAMRRQASPDALRRPRGVMLLSPPGCGKSAFAKSLGNETGRPTLILDIGRLMGSLVGESEQRTRQALRTIDAMAPCVAMLDEVEKALAGAGGGQGDSGVASRMFGTLLTCPRAGTFHFTEALYEEDT
jgi:hypothetical protein